MDDVDGHGVVNVEQGPGPAVDSRGEGVEANVDANADGGDGSGGHERDGTTLPIPGFILSAGARSSLVGYEKRRDVS